MCSGLGSIDLKGSIGAAAGSVDTDKVFLEMEDGDAATEVQP